MPRRADSDTVQLKVRIKEPVRAALERAAEQRGVSMNAEIAARLERSLSEETALGGRTGRQLAYLAASAFNMAGRMRGSGREDWPDDPQCVRAGVFAAIDALLSVMPDASPEEIALEIEVLKGKLLTRVAMRKGEAA